MGEYNILKTLSLLGPFQVLIYSFIFKSVQSLLQVKGGWGGGGGAKMQIPQAHQERESPPPGGGGVLRFGSDGCVPLKPPNLYPFLRVILAETGTHY